MVIFDIKSSDKPEAVFNAISQYINKPIIEVRNELEKIIIDSFQKKLTEKQVKELVDNITTSIKNMNSTTLENYKSIIISYLNAAELTATQAVNITRYYYNIREELQNGITQQLLKDSTKKLETILKNNRDFDSRYFSKLINGGLNENEIKKTLANFEKVFGNQYKALYEQKLLLQEKQGLVKIFTEKVDGKTRHFFEYTKNGKKYDLEKYVEVEANNEISNITRLSNRAEGLQEKPDLVQFVRVRAVLTPRDSHEAIEGEVFSISGESADYRSVKELENLPAGDEIYIDGWDNWVFPYGCGHTFTIYEGV